MESNDKLEQLLQQMYAQESLHDDDIDTSDIIDEEWTKFEAEHFGGERSEITLTEDRSNVCWSADALRNCFCCRTHHQ